jgi:hypothetical protein
MIVNKSRPFDAAAYTTTTRDAANRPPVYFLTWQRAALPLPLPCPFFTRRRFQVLPERTTSVTHLRTRSKFPFAAAALAAGLAVSTSMAPSAFAQETVVAKVNGKVITESDIKLADAEIGSELGNLPEATKRRVLIEFLIENQLFADAAEGQKLGSGKAYDERLQYWKRRALRDTYFDKSIKDGVDEAEAKKLYDSQVAQIKPEEEVKARHILVKTEEKAKEIAVKIASGETPAPRTKAAISASLAAAKWCRSSRKPRSS